jgi:hypothetical protein
VILSLANISFITAFLSWSQLILYILFSAEEAENLRRQLGEFLTLQITHLNASLKQLTHKNLDFLSALVTNNVNRFDLLDAMDHGQTPTRQTDAPAGPGME